MNSVSQNRVSTREKSQKAVAQIAVSGMMLCLALAMEGISKCIPFFKWPFGGSISITMVPLILTALYCGTFYGTFVGVAFGCINFLMDGVISWTANTTAVLLSLLLDYVIGFGCCGLASIFRRKFFEKKEYSLLAAVLLCGVVRLISSFFSGMIVFTNSFDYESTSGLSMDFTWGGFTYSLGYNAGYMVPSIILNFLVMLVLVKPIFLVQNTPFIARLVPKDLDKDSKGILPGMEKLMPLYLLMELAFGIVSMIVPLYISYFGYFAIALGVGLIGYEIYHIVKNWKEMNPTQRMLSVLYISIAAVGIGLGITGCLSQATYGNAAYLDHFGE
jgi:thiamine transporter